MDLFVCESTSSLTNVRGSRVAVKKARERVAETREKRNMLKKIGEIMENSIYWTKLLSDSIRSIIWQRLGKTKARHNNESVTLPQNFGTTEPQDARTSS